MSWNLMMVVWLSEARTPFFSQFFSIVTEFGGGAVVTLVLIAAAFVLWRGKRWAHALGLITALVGALGVSEFLKITVREARPPAEFHAILESGYSFPSNHAAAAMALYGFLAWTLFDTKSRVRAFGAIILSLLIFGVGFSRVYLGVHYPTDVLGGYAVGIIFVYIGTRITKKLELFED